MVKALNLVKALDTATPKREQISRTKPRRQRRQEIRNTVKANSQKKSA
jgi:hypothetical protein